MNRMSAMVLRLFLPSDLDSLKNLILSTITTCYAGVYPPRVIQYFKQYHSDEQILQRAKEGCTIVIERDGKAIATGSIVGGHVCAVFVVPEIQRQGLGRRIMEHLEDKARSAGFKEVNLHVSLPSKRFYERLGYRLSEDAYLDVGEGQRLDYWEAKKPLFVDKAQ
jgi:GNAT superfamily N-acetyltransferase